MARAARTRKEPAEAQIQALTGAENLVGRQKSLVFISHDSRDAELAEAFANLLVDVSAGTLKSFRSSDKKGNSGIEFGAEWYSAIMSQLSDATDVVALLTPRSIDRPWILYEAGVARGKLDTTVFGIALGVPLERVSTGPFGQFQNCGDDEDSLTKLVMQLLERNPDASPREAAVRMQVQIFRTQVQNALPKTLEGQEPATEEPNIAKLFEEVKAMVRELPGRVDDRVRSATRRGNGRALRRFDPMMIEEILFRPRFREDENGYIAAWLMFVSLFKDDFPPIYEGGMELYRAMRSGKASDVDRSMDQFMTVTNMYFRSEFSRDLHMSEDKEQFFMVRHLPDMAERFLKEIRHRRPPRKAVSGIGSHLE